MFKPARPGTTRTQGGPMCGLGAIGILVFGVIVLLLVGVYGACLWYIIARRRRRRE